MLDPSQQARFAKSCSDAVVGYANAATAAYANWAFQAFEALAGAMRGMQPTPPPRSWYREPPPERREPASGIPALPFAAPAGLPPLPWLAFAWPGAQPSASAATAMNPWAAWFEMLSFRGPPAAWPFAFMLVAVGVPRNVAWPAAEANLAALDAAEIARRSLETAFSTYRTDGGHASAQIAWPSASVNGTASPPYFPIPFWPWIGMPRPSGG